VKFDIYGRFQVDVLREGDAWIAYRMGDGKRRRLHDIVIPADTDEAELATWLDDVFHEYAGLGQRVEVVHG